MKIKVYKESQESVSYYKFVKDLVAFNKEDAFLKEIDSIALKQSLRHLDTACQNFFHDKKIGFPKFKSKETTQGFIENHLQSLQMHKENYQNVFLEVTDIINKNIKLHYKKRRNAYTRATIIILKPWDTRA